MKEIIFFVPSIQSGGTESVAKRYCIEMKKYTKVKVYSIVRNDMYYEFDSHYVFENTSTRLYKLIGCPALRPIFYIYIFAKLVKITRVLPSHIICLGELPILIASPLALISKIFGRIYKTPKFVTSIRNNPSTINWWKRYVMGLLLYCYHENTTNSVATAKNFFQLPFLNKGILPLYNPLPPIVSREERKERGEKKYLNIISISRLEKQKNISSIIEFIDYINRKSNHIVKLKIIGEGVELISLKQKCKRYGLEDDIMFLGKRRYEEISEIMQRSDALVHFSLWDGIPNTVLEALCHSVPIFAYDSPKSSLSELKKFGAPIYFFSDFRQNKLMQDWERFVGRDVNDKKFEERSRTFYKEYERVSSLKEFIAQIK